MEMGMLKHLLLLISLLCPSVAIAEPIESNTEISGFAYTTQFSDQSWHNSKTVMAINVDHMHKFFDIRWQITTYENSPIRRLSIGTTRYITEHSYATFQLGRVSRFNSFFDNIVDTPAASGMAMLPQAGYSYRMWQGAFVLADGAKLDYTLGIKDHLVTAHYTRGYMVIPDQKEFKLELLKKNIDGITFEPNDGNTFELHHECKDYHGYISTSRYAVNNTLQSNTPTAKYYYTNANIAKYDLYKAGLKYDNGKLFGLVEYTNGYSHVYSITGTLKAKTEAVDQAVVLGMYFGEGWFIYTGESLGTNLTAKTNALENFTGITKRLKSLTMSVAYHEGRGQGWMKYEALPPYEWKSVVTSVTYQF